MPPDAGRPQSSWPRRFPTWVAYGVHGPCCFSSRWERASSLRSSRCTRTRWGSTTPSSPCFWVCTCSRWCRACSRSGSSPTKWVANQCCWPPSRCWPSRRSSSCRSPALWGCSWPAPCRVPPPARSSAPARHFSWMPARPTSAGSRQRLHRSRCDSVWASGRASAGCSSSTHPTHSNCHSPRIWCFWPSQRASYCGCPRRCCSETGALFACAWRCLPPSGRCSGGCLCHRG